MTNRGTRLFLITDLKNRDGPYRDLMIRSGLRLLRFSKNGTNGDPWRCGFCGSLNVWTHLKCAACAGPRWSQVRNGRALLECYWDDAMRIEGLQDPYELHVMWASCGDPSNYGDQRMLARLMGCKVEKKWMRNLTITNREAEVLSVNFRIACDFVLFDGKEALDITERLTGLRNVV